MNFHRVTGKIKTSYISEPYSLLTQYKRAYKFLRLVKQNSGKILVLGNRNHFGLNWQAAVSGNGANNVTHHTKLDDQVISSSPKEYSMILCLDPTLFAKSLYRAHLPVMTVATPKELHDHPEIIKMTDYLLPAPTSRHDMALAELLRRETMDVGTKSTAKG